MENSLMSTDRPHDTLQSSTDSNDWQYHENSNHF